MSKQPELEEESLPLKIREVLPDQLLTVEDMARILQKSSYTIRNGNARCPELYPPSFKLPGSRRIYYRAETVNEWLKAAEQKGREIQEAERAKKQKAKEKRQKEFRMMEEHD